MTPTRVYRIVWRDGKPVCVTAEAIEAMLMGELAASLDRAKGHDTGGER